jgi:hypothetical protein
MDRLYCMPPDRRRTDLCFQRLYAVCMRQSRTTYTPLHRGWISIQDRHSFVIGAIDCTAVNAQGVLDQLCEDFKRAGWTLYGRGSADIGPIPV